VAGEVNEIPLEIPPVHEYEFAPDPLSVTLVPEQMVSLGEIE